MKISPPQAVTRLAARFQERRAKAALGERPPLTTEDEDHIASFAHVINALTSLLEEENDALRQGDVDHIAHLFESKSDLLKTIETRQPVIEPFLRESAEVTEILRPRIRALAERLEENRVLLATMAEASQVIRAEVTRVRDRHSLKGMYGKTGQTLEGGSQTAKKVDTKF